MKLGWVSNIRTRRGPGKAWRWCGPKWRQPRPPLAVDGRLLAAEQALGPGLIGVFVGINNPDLMALPAETASAVQGMLKELQSGGQATA